MVIIASSKHCEKCNKDFEFGEMTLGRENKGRGKERVFLCCPICGTEIKNVLLKEEENRR